MSTDDTRTRILAAAGPVFASKGYEKATVGEICAAAKVNLASVNYHFSNKETLYQETVKQSHQQRAAAIPMPEFVEGVAAETQLRGVVKAMFHRMVSPAGETWQGKLMMRELIEPTGAFRELARDSFRPQFERLMAIIGQITPPQTPVAKLRQLAFSVIGQCLHYRVGAEIVDVLTPADEREEYFSADALATHISDVIIAAAKSCTAATTVDSCTAATTVDSTAAGCNAAEDPKSPQPQHLPSD